MKDTLSDTPQPKNNEPNRPHFKGAKKEPNSVQTTPNNYETE